MNLQEQLDLKLQQRQARETGICQVAIRCQARETGISQVAARRPARETGICQVAIISGAKLGVR
jgi:hypothetical protein